jgi:tetratricopeptide (TPR) repeat protein
MRFLVSIIFSSLIIVGCSSQKEISNTQNDDKIVSSIDKKKALEYFINGSAAESKGDYATAILEFQDALKYDNSGGVYYALAKNYFFLNKLPSALQNSRKSVELEPDNLEYLNLLQEIYSSGKQNDSSILVLEKIISLDSTQVNAYYKLARAFEINKPVQAIKIYNKINKLIGSEWSVLIRVAELYERLGDDAKAIETIEELVKLDPSNPMIQKLLIDFYNKKGEYEKSIAALDQILELYPDDEEALERKAQVYLMMKEWEKSSTIYTSLFEKPGVSLDAKIRIAYAYFIESFKDSTILPMSKKLFTILDKDTTDWQVKMYLGGIALREYEDTIAIKYFKEVTELAPWNPEAWLQLGSIYYENKDYEHASTIFKQALEKFPEDFPVNFMLGVTLVQLAKYTDAEPVLAKAVELNGKDVFALSAYGHTLSQLKKSDSAIDYLKRAIKIEPSNVDLLGSLGLIYDNIEKWDECDSIYTLALKTDPNNALVNNNYSYSLSKRGIRLEEALNMVTLSLNADPLNSSYLDTKGWVYYKMGSYDSAKVYIERSLSVSGDKAVVLDHLGDVYFKLGDKNKAVDIWKKALELDSSIEAIKSKIEKGEL